MCVTCFQRLSETSEGRLHLSPSALSALDAVEDADVIFIKGFFAETILPG